MTNGPTILLRPERKNLPPQEVPLHERYGEEIACIERYANTVTDDGRDIEHPLRVARLANDFSAGQMNDELFGAAILHDIAQRATGEEIPRDYVKVKSTQKLLGAYSRSEYARQILPRAEDDRVLTRWQYQEGVLADLNIVEKYAEANRRVKMPGKSDETLAITRSHGVGKVTNKACWLEPSAITPPADMEKLLDKVKGEGANLEAVVIKAVEKLDALMYPSENEQSMLRNIHDAESFYAPICEYIGMPALASALRSWANITRLEKSGHEPFVAKAKEIVERTGDPEESLRSTERLLGKLGLGDVEVDWAIRDTTGHGITVGTAALGVSAEVSGVSEYREARAVWRDKSVGAIALKLLTDHKELLYASSDKQIAGLKNTERVPADEHGIAIITEDLDLLASMFAHATMSVHRDPDLMFAMSPSRMGKGQALHAKGSRAYVRAMAGALMMHPDNVSEDGKQVVWWNNIDAPKGESHYMVAKITCEHEGHRTEIQFQTERDRIEGTIGLAAHSLYKLLEHMKEFASGAEAGWVESLTKVSVASMKNIHRRAGDIGNYILADPEGPRSRSFRKAISSSGAQWLPWQAYKMR